MRAVKNGEILLLILSLIIQSWKDIRERRISVPVLIVTCLLGGSLQIVSLLFLSDGSAGAGELTAVFGSAIPGLLFLLLSVLSGNRIGFGDGLVLLGAGLFLDISDLTASLFLGMILCAVFAGIGIALGKLRKDTEIPFVPFLLLAYLLVLAGEGL